MSSWSSNRGVTLEVWIGPVIIAAAIAAVINVLGWVVTGRREHRAAERRRAEQRGDISTALLAEIVHYRDALTFFDLDKGWSDVVTQMEADESYLPFVPSERNDTIFRAILGEIHILPEAVILPVTRYYNQVFAIEAIIADLRAEAVRREPQGKRIAIFTDYISLKKEALVAAEAAIGALEQQLSVTRAGARLTGAGGR